MLHRLLLHSFVILSLFSSTIKEVAAQNDPITRVWYIEEKTAKIEIYKAVDGKYYGKVVWLKVPTVRGHQKIDINNPDEKKRDQPLLGLVILKGFVKTSENHYEYGTVYDPKSGRTYSCKMSICENKLHVRGYLGISLLGKSAVWTKAE